MRDKEALIKTLPIKWHKRPKCYTILLILLVLKVMLLTTLLYKDTIAQSFAGHSNKLTKYYSELRLDTRNAPSEREIVQHITKELPYLPIKDLLNKRFQQRNLNNSCAWYPSMSDIRIRNDYWQQFFVANLTFYFFGAYLDNRPSVVEDQPVVRILATMPGLIQWENDYPKNIYCQFWYQSQAQPIIRQAREVRHLWYWGWGRGIEHNYGHMLVCPLPENHKTWIPSTVSVVASPCAKATNMLKIVYDPLKVGEKKKGFAVCVKNLDFPYADLSHRVVEWMETVRSLGAEKVVMYDMHLVHPNTSKVLNYYQRTGFLDYHGFSISLDFASELEIRHLQMANAGWDYVLHEVITYNDCFYRNMYHYQHFAVIDIDEVPMPLGNLSSWAELTEYGEQLKDPNCKKFTSFCFRCIYFPRFATKPLYNTELPGFFYMLQHVRRVKEYMPEGHAIKCLHNSDRLIATHNHFPIHVVKDTCKSYTFNTSVAHLHHYREPPEAKWLEDPVEDVSLWRLKSEIVKRSMQVFDDLDFFAQVADNSTRR